jgi:hypothetical protein
MRTLRLSYSLDRLPKDDLLPTRLPDKVQKAKWRLTIGLLGVDSGLTFIGMDGNFIGLYVLGKKWQSDRCLLFPENGDSMCP